jgi:peptide chain release factor 3
VPIFTFMNKLDRPAREPLELLDELETVLGIGACAMNWPLGLGQQFRGVYDRQAKEVHLFERTVHGAFRAPEKVGSLQDEFVKQHTVSEALEQAVMELEMLDGAGHPFDREAVNFGVQLLLDGFLALAPPPKGRMAAGREVLPSAPNFSGFVFKIQANMDPRHRDRMSYVRIVSGRFERDMQAINTRSGKMMRLGNSQKLFAQDRETVNEAWAGDVVGIVGNYDFRIGDTLSHDATLKFDEIPRFAPEVFCFLHNPTTAKYKSFREGLEQLLSEGVVQQFTMPQSGMRIPLLGAVGPLQFEVVQYRLQSEYNAESRLEQSPWSIVRWITAPEGMEMPGGLVLGTGMTTALDVDNRWVLLCGDAWTLDYFDKKNPEVRLSEVPV